MRVNELMESRMRANERIVFREINKGKGMRYPLKGDDRMVITDGAEDFFACLNFQVVILLHALLLLSDTYQILNTRFIIFYRLDS